MMKENGNSFHFITDAGYPQPSDEELKNIFAASCIESVARQTKQPASVVYRRMKKADLFSQLIYPCYDTLHTQSREIVIQDLLEALRIRETASQQE